MEEWKFAEVLATLRDYQLLLNQVAVFVISGACVLAYKNRRLASRQWSLGLTIVALISSIITLVLGLLFRSKLIDTILALNFTENPASLTDETLKCLLLSQVSLLSIAALLLVAAAATTPRDRITNGT